MINFIHIILFALVSAKTNEEELREAACVIFSRYILQIQSQQASPQIGKLIKEQNYNQDDAIYVVQAAALDKCLINIKQREVTRILDGLQNQQLELEKYTHLHDNIQYDRFINNKQELAKLNQLTEIIKDVEELIQTQWQKRPDVEKRRQEQRESEEMDQEILDQLNEVPIVEQFDLTKFSLKHILLKNKEYLIFAIFILVPIVLISNVCCKSRDKNDKKSSDKKSVKNEKKESTKSNTENKEVKESSPAKKSGKSEKSKSKKE
ncbi:unnamed protein product (macronuclear) [Paramecium tetraurelia]|uniref:Transmembrane protein n=1 Tax=Paramecium tetraurelia TaxID=5888 RepID=A0D8N3_PARTE|nr:uncharacterized protein GSPATT00014346001 [Paramecium tetraurelia]CAK79400.1 unnamed protein product [Paramecium tetraurelia]|eukprot:XP_001446797.1 hypothetical protein (macronuclear) [Paramecium tetraurelia strain d4-2]